MPPAEVVTCDARGRIVLPLLVRQRFGSSFHVVKSVDEVILVPVSRDPLKELSALGKKAGLSKMPLSRIKQEIRRQAVMETGE